jgi:hypothetical protein
LQLIKYLRVFPTTRVASTHQLSAHYQHSLVRSHDTIHVRCGCSSTKEYQRHPQFAQLQQFPQFIQLPQFARSKEQHHVAQPGWRHAARRSRGRPQASHLPTVHAATLIHRHATAIYTAAIIPRHATPLRACSEHSLPIRQPPNTKETCASSCQALATTQMPRFLAEYPTKQMLFHPVLRHGGRGLHDHIYGAAVWPLYG